MHPESLKIMSNFIVGLDAQIKGLRPTVLDVGSQTVGGTKSYKELFPSRWSYTGLDVEPGENVDYVVNDRYSWKGLDNHEFDLVISGQAFEHIEFPWLTIQEIKRVMKIGGHAVLIAPSSGWIHRYPVDCWRFLPDGWVALAKWAGLKVIRSDISGQEPWYDCFCLLQKE
jgi:SAM-dependent methyltransferase